LESPYNLTVSDIEAHANALLEFHAAFADFFRKGTAQIGVEIHAKGGYWMDKLYDPLSQSIFLK